MAYQCYMLLQWKLYIISENAVEVDQETPHLCPLFIFLAKGSHVFASIFFILFQRKKAISSYSKFNVYGLRLYFVYYGNTFWDIFVTGIYFVDCAFNNW